MKRIYKWSDNNNLQFNELKFQAMRYGVNTETMDCEYKTPTGTPIPNESTVKDLGILQSNIRRSFSGRWKPIFFFPSLSRLLTNKR